LDDFTIPDSPGRMGRPPLGNSPTQVRLSEEQKARIDALVGGQKRRAQFIRDAIDEKLERDEAANAAKPTGGDGEG